MVRRCMVVAQISINKKIVKIMVDVAFYLVSEDIARRCGLIGQRYRVGYKYILDNKDLSRLRLTSDEYVHGLQGIEEISNEEAKRLIVQGGYNMTGTGNGTTQTVEEPNPEPEPENNEATTEGEVPAAEEEVIDTEGVGDANDILGNGSEEENNNNEPKEEEE